jgi:hypothetical protein
LIAAGAPDDAVCRAITPPAPLMMPPLRHYDITAFVLVIVTPFFDADTMPLERHFS